MLSCSQMSQRDAHQQFIPFWTLICFPLCSYFMYSCAIAVLIQPSCKISEDWPSCHPFSRCIKLKTLLPSRGRVEHCTSVHITMATRKKPIVCNQWPCDHSAIYRISCTCMISPALILNCSTTDLRIFQMSSEMAVFI